MIILIHKCTLLTIYRFDQNLQNSCVCCPKTAKDNSFLIFIFYEKEINITEIKQSNIFTEIKQSNINLITIIYELNYLMKTVNKN